ncbi:MAG TPA: hypothetical protein PLY45_06920, partial [bacterium]|nr:hypothetical protein [bacterium]
MTGKIDVSGKGYPGGTSGGTAYGLGESTTVSCSPLASPCLTGGYLGYGAYGLYAGGGAGSGGAGGDGYAAAGGYGFGGRAYSTAVNPAFEPVKAGGGGGADFEAGDFGPAGKGGAGGGVVKIVVGGTLTMDGDVLANGEAAVSDDAERPTGGGGGGSIWVDTVELAGSGKFEAKGGDSAPAEADYGAGGGGGGKISVTYHEGSGYSASGDASAAGGRSLAAEGAKGGDGAAGEIVFSKLAGARVTISSNTTISGAACAANSLDAVTINSGVTVTVNCDPATYPDGWKVAVLTVNGTLTHLPFAVGGNQVGLAVTANDIAIGTTGKIDATGKGYAGRYGDSNGY